MVEAVKNGMVYINYIYSMLIYYISNTSDEISTSHYICVIHCVIKLLKVEQSELTLILKPKRSSINSIIEVKCWIHN